MSPGVAGAVSEHLSACTVGSCQISGTASFVSTTSSSSVVTPSSIDRAKPYSDSSVCSPRPPRCDCRSKEADGAAWTGAASYTVPQEAQDAVGLLNHLAVGKVAVLGTSRGGLIGMVLAALAKDRLLGLCLNDVGPVIERAGLERIFDYVGRNPAAKNLEDMAARLARGNPGFEGVSAARWLSEAQHHYIEVEGGLKINYDPALREAFLAAFDGPIADGWPFFDALAGLPVGLIRGANTDLLSLETVAEMQRRRPDMIYASVPGRAHVPFLDEPESLVAIAAFLRAVA